MIVQFIEIKGVSKQFGKDVVLQDVNLTIEQGDVFGIIGTSGSGKTTLLNLISGFMEPTQGNVSYVSNVDQSEKDLHDHFKHIKRHIGFTPQHSAVYPKLTVMENLMHFGYMYGLRKETLLRNAENLLHFTNLYKHKSKVAEQLSGGMQKRLDIACSLMHKPKLLFLDEPTANLDPVMERDIINLIKAVNEQGITVVLASHHLESIERISSKFAIIDHGVVQSYGDMEAVRKPYLQDTIRINVRAGCDNAKVVEIAQELDVSKILDTGHQVTLFPTNTGSAMTQLLQRLQEEGLGMDDIEVRKLSLKDIFHRITEEEK
jgi:ABC-2 type transport system ATP-binding protein